MKYALLPVLFFICIFNEVKAQITSPDEFLGYELGSKFTHHDQVVAYFKYIAAQDAAEIKLVSYGKTYEGRELLTAFISSKENITNLEQIRKNNFGLSKMQKSGPEKMPVVVWLSYNVHGNEANSTETSMKTLYALVNPATKDAKKWLKNTVVVIDPCLNPDGRERYVNFFNGVSGDKPNPNPMAREHSEPWPGGRYNHYYYDLNRDWAWQTQIETQQRLKLYREWMPEVHVDFHEQGYDDPYYFAPAAEPVHEDITAWQKEFQVTVGKVNAGYFDEYGWKYFTKERFDLLYPSYGDTYPLYNGAIGMTYEQGGIGAGLAVVTSDGDTLTLKDRIAHHYTTGMATIETASNNADKLVAEFKAYFEKSAAAPPGVFKSYVIKADALSKIRKMAALLKNNGIEFAFGGDKVLKGYSYANKKAENFKLERNDLVVNLYQPAAVLANVLLEPQTVITDSNTYDITSWALPYAYGLNAYALKESVKGTFSAVDDKTDRPATMDKPYAWVFPWKSITDAQVLIALQKANVKVRVAGEGFTSGGRTFEAGSLLVYRSENEKAVKELADKISQIQKSLDVQAYPVASGYVEKGKDFGSYIYPLINQPKVAVVAGTGTSATAVGEVWHFMEQELKYPVTLLGVKDLASLDVNKVNVLILPDGTYSDIADKLDGWINNGGKLILFDEAIGSLIGKKPFTIKAKEAAKDTDSLDRGPYAKRYKDDMANAIPGAVFKVALDKSHPLSAGLGDYYYALKTDDKIYEPLKKAWNVGTLKPGSYLSGIAGKSVLKKLDNGMLFGVQEAGKGTIVYMGSDILFRSFWENGKQMFVNTVFLTW